MSKAAWFFGQMFTASGSLVTYGVITKLTGTTPKPIEAGTGALTIWVVAFLVWPWISDWIAELRFPWRFRIERRGQ